MRLPAATGVVLALAALALASTAHAHIVSDRGVTIWKSLPASLEPLLASGHPDSTGAVGGNRGGWVHVCAQSPAMLRLLRAAAIGDSTTSEDSWRAIDLSWVQQVPAGNYLSRASGGGAITRVADLHAVAEWLGELLRADVVVENGPLRARFIWRISLMLPKLRNAVHWLEAGADTLWSLDQRRPDRLLVSAQAFLLADGLLHEEHLNALGQRSLVAALALQQPDGRFRGDGVGSAGAQARCLHSLQEVTTYFSAPSLERAVASSARWLTRQVKSDGRISSAAAAPGGNGAPDVGPCQALDERATERLVAEALLIHAQRTGDRAAGDAAGHILTRLAKEPRER